MNRLQLWFFNHSQPTVSATCSAGAATGKVGDQIIAISWADGALQRWYHFAMRSVGDDIGVFEDRIVLFTWIFSNKSPYNIFKQYFFFFKWKLISFFA